MFVVYCLGILGYMLPVKKGTHSYITAYSNLFGSAIMCMEILLSDTVVKWTVSFTTLVTHLSRLQTEEIYQLIMLDVSGYVQVFLQGLYLWWFRIQLM